MTVVPSSYPRQPNEMYQTPAWATRALLKRLPSLAGLSVWEPCAGNHKMADILSEAGALVITSDLVTYERPHAFEIDFLSDAPAFLTDMLITNPPYGAGNHTAAKCVRLALDRCPGWVAMLLTAKFDFGKTRVDLFANNPRFAFKINLVDRIKWFAGPVQGTENHAWFVWEPAGLHLYRSPRLFYEGRDE